MNDDTPFFFIGVILCALVCAFLPNTSVTNAEWEFASKSCQNNGGVQYTRGSGAIRAQKVICVNGAEFVRPRLEETDDGR